MPEIPDDAIHAYAAALIRNYAAGLDYLDLAEEMFNDTTVGGVCLADLDGPEIDDVQRRILDAAHAAAVLVGWPADGKEPMTLARVAELDDRYGPGRRRMDAGAKTEALRVVQELIEEMRRRFRADVAGAAFEITALHDCDLRETWVHVIHTPCQETVFGNPDDAEDLDAGELLARIAAHRCDPDAAADPGADDHRSNQMLDVAVDGDTVTAAIHGPRPLDAEEQAHMADIVRAGIRAEREKRREEARQRDEDVRAVARVLDVINVTWRRVLDAKEEVFDAQYALKQRFADRIADVRRRDTETTATRPADGPDGAVRGAGLGNALPEPQRGPQGDEEAEG